LQYIQVPRLHEIDKPTNLPSKFFIIGNRFHLTSSRAKGQIEGASGPSCKCCVLCGWNGKQTRNQCYHNFHKSWQKNKLFLLKQNLTC